ncbi:MAG: hypothetical protein ACKVOI_00485 [Dongiaceae bacterium]
MIEFAQLSDNPGSAMEKIRQIAVLSVRRACGFGALGIAMIMWGLIYDPVLAFQSGAVLTAIVAVILYYRAMQAPQRDHTQTEVWLLLDKELRPPPDYARRIVNSTLCDVYHQHARWAIGIAALFAVISLFSRMTLA